jgi:hypothetical protein
MSKLIPVALAALLALSFACKDGGVEVLPSPEGTGTPTWVPAASPTATPGEGVCEENPDPATPDFQVIEEPAGGDSATSPVTISGQVLAFEGTYQIGIFDADGEPIVETFGTAEAGEIGELAPFSIDVLFDVTESTPACIWVYEQSAMDGEPIHVGQVPVTLEPGGEPPVCAPNPDPATPDMTFVDAPSSGDSVTSPLTVSGQIAAFEAQFNITLYDADGDPIVDVPAMSEEGNTLAPFSTDIEFEVSEETPACLWVYDISEADGEPSQVAQVPLTLLP